MKELTIGDIIKYQINKKSILPEKLTEGLCSASSLKRDELGFLVEEKTYAADRMTGSNENSKGKYKQSYQLFEPMKAGEKDEAPIERAYKK